MSNKNNSPEQKASWEANKKLVSKFVKVIPSSIYSLLDKSKAPSRRDKHRMAVAETKA